VAPDGHFVPAKGLNRRGEFFIHKVSFGVIRRDEQAPFSFIGVIHHVPILPEAIHITVTRIAHEKQAVGGTGFNFASHQNFIDQIVGKHILLQDGGGGVVDALGLKVTGACHRPGSGKLNPFFRIEIKG